MIPTFKTVDQHRLRPTKVRVVVLVQNCDDDVADANVAARDQFSDTYWDCVERLLFAVEDYWFCPDSESVTCGGNISGRGQRYQWSDSFIYVYSEQTRFHMVFYCSLLQYLSTQFGRLHCGCYKYNKKSSKVLSC